MKRMSQGAWLLGLQWEIFDTTFRTPSSQHHGHLKSISCSDSNKNPLSLLLCRQSQIRLTVTPPLVWGPWGSAGGLVFFRVDSLALRPIFCWNETPLVSARTQSTQPSLFLNLFSNCRRICRPFLSQLCRMISCTVNKGFATTHYFLFHFYATVSLEYII